MTALDIARRELRSLFVTPLAWVALAAVQFVVAWMFLLQIDLFMELQPQLAGRDGAPGLTAIVVAPMLGTPCHISLGGSFTSAPTENARSPAACSTATRSSPSSNRCHADCRPRMTSSLSAFIRSARFIVTVAIRSLDS